MIDSYTKTPRPLRHVDVDYVVDQTKCAECKDKPCLESCPIDAIYIDETDGLIKLKTTCFGCVLCRNACPFDAISLDVNMDPPLKENVPNINAITIQGVTGAVAITPVGDTRMARLESLSTAPGFPYQPSKAPRFGVWTNSQKERS